MIYYGTYSIIIYIINIIPENEKVFILKFYDIEQCSAVEVLGSVQLKTKLISEDALIFSIFIG